MVGQRPADHQVDSRIDEVADHPVRALLITLNMIRVGFLLTLCLTLSACGTYGNNGDDGSSSALNLNGQWTGACHANALSSGYASGSLTMLSGSMHAEIYNSPVDNGCQTVDLKTTTDSTYVVGDNLTTPANAKAFNTVISSMITTPLTAARAAALNAALYCGLANWQSGVAQEVAARGCGGEPPQLGRTYYGVISQVGPQLFFGQKSTVNDGSSAARRPTSLNLVDFYAQ